MAAEVGRWKCIAQELGSETAVATVREFDGAVDVSGYKPGVVLLCGDAGVLLGV